MFQAPDEGEKAAAVVILLRQQRLLPAPLITQTLHRRKNQIRLTETRRVAIHTTFQNTEVGKHLAQRDTLPRRQRQIMRPARRTQIAADEGGVIAVALQPFGENDIALPLPRQKPQRGKRRRTAAKNKHIANLRPRRLRVGVGKSPIAQQMPKRQTNTPHGKRRRTVKLTMRQPGRGSGNADGSGLREKTTAVVPQNKFLNDKGRRKTARERRLQRQHRAPSKEYKYIAIHRKPQTRRAAEDSARLYGEAA